MCEKCKVCDVLAVSLSDMPEEFLHTEETDCGGDEQWSCFCPVCGRYVCGSCV